MNNNMNSAMKTVGVSLAVGTAAAVCGRRWLCHSLGAAFFRLRSPGFEKGCKKGGKHHKYHCR